MMGQLQYAGHWVTGKEFLLAHELSRLGHREIALEILRAADHTLRGMVDCAVGFNSDAMLDGPYGALARRDIEAQLREAERRTLEICVAALGKSLAARSEGRRKATKKKAKRATRRK